MNESKKTSIESTKKIEGIRTDQLTVPTMGIVITLLIIFFILKKFIYIKDPKRHGQ